MNRINIVCVGVWDMQESLAFYKAIGFKTHEKEDAPPVVFFDNAGSKLELYPIEALARDISAETPPAVREKGFGGFTLAINMKEKGEVDAFLQQVERCGGTVAKPAQDLFWGGYGGYCMDPNGVYWEVAWGPTWRFDENDMLVLEDGG